METKEVLKSELQKVKPSQEELKQISILSENFLSLLKPELQKIAADVVLGGSFSKNTLIKKGGYDLDFFVRFKSDQDASDKLEKALKNTIKKLKSKSKLYAERLHGSRDYFRIKVNGPVPLSLELVPVLKIKTLKEAKNVTDLSPSHAEYIKKKIKKRLSLADEIRLVKSFCYAQSCYGAESYIKGFSGYALELLTCYYGSFLKLAKAASKWHAKVLIDPSRHYKGKQALLLLNKAKVESPLILIDPTQPERNATAALSMESFDKFVKNCKEFLKKPSSKFFAEKVIDKEELEKEAKRKKAELIVLKVESNKTKEDVAGAKLLGFFESVHEKIKKEFKVYRAEWAFDAKEKSGEFYFIISPIGEVIIRGPPVAIQKHASRFKKQWHNSFVKNKSLFATRKSKPLKEILREIKDLEERGIRGIILI